jgi:hypothetical protein
MAIRVFHASKLEKALLTSAWASGYFITPITQFLATKVKTLKTMDWSRIYMFAVAAISFASAFITSFKPLLVMLIVATILFKQPASLMADVYGQNYSMAERGTRVACVLMALPLPTLILFPIFGKLMDINLSYYRLVLLFVALAAVGSGISFSKIPSRVLPMRKEKSIFSNFGIVFKDKLFGMMLLWWTISGIATQMSKPLRTEYLINPAYGINAPNLFETWACITIPFGCRILSTLPWGNLFNKCGVITVKMAVNLFLMVGLLLFFHSRTEAMISLAAVILGIAQGGGEVIWCLWITKIAPKDDFSAYMSVNVVTAGLKGSLSPFLGYYLSNRLTLQQISLIAAGLVLVSIIGFCSLWRHPRFEIQYDPI